MPGRKHPRRRRYPAAPASEDGASPVGVARRAGSPRRTAYDVLAAVHDRAAYANLLLPRLLAERGITGRDAALATELTYGTLRGQGSYDAVLAACSDRRLDKLDPPVRHVLRLGAHQLLATRVGAHAAVSTSVDLARAVAGPRVTGYVNAVLRRVATRDLNAWLEIVAPAPMADRDGYLAIRHSHPRWIVDAYREALGAQADAPADEFLAGEVPAEAAGPAVTELEAALAVGNSRPRVTMAAYPAGPPRGEVMPADAVPGHWSPYAFTLHGGDPAPLADAGLAAVQDEGSQLAAIALARAPIAREGAGAEAERWLDMCAGPGGKARLLAGLAATAGQGARLIAADIRPHRAALIRQALDRVSRSASARPATAARSAEPRASASADARGWAVVAADGTRPPLPDGAFDRVLVDAPCSGLGALRRRPEARWRKSPDDIPALARLQRDLLRQALAVVRPGGVVGYVTCSPLPAETRDVVTDVVSVLEDIEILDAPAALPDVPGTRSGNPLFAQLWPHRHGTDAIFIALLRRGRH